MKAGVISLGGKSSIGLAKSMREFFDEVDELNLKSFRVHLTDDGFSVKYEGKDLENYDCIYIRGSYKYALLQRSITRALKKKVYMPLKPSSFTLGHDKFLTLLELQQNDVAIPKTYYAATRFRAIEILKEEVKYPVIIKVPEGTHGKGVMVADSLQSARTILDMLEGFGKQYIIQEFVSTKNTSDIRVIVVGSKVVAAYCREACDGEIRANIHSGGTRKQHLLKKSEEKLALKSAKAIGADICGVDILNSKNPSVIEINLSPSMYALEELTSVDVLREVAKYLYEKTLKFKKKKEEKFKKKLNKKKNGNKKKKIQE